MAINETMNAVVSQNIGSFAIVSVFALLGAAVGAWIGSESESLFPILGGAIVGTLFGYIIKIALLGL